MGISIRSILFVGAHGSDIKCDQSILDNELPEGMSDEEAEDLPYIERISPYYDAENKHCYYGVEIQCHDLMEPGRVGNVLALIDALKELFQTEKVSVMHSPHVC